MRGLLRIDYHPASTAATATLGTTSSALRLSACVTTVLFVSCWDNLPQIVLTASSGKSPASFHVRFHGWRPLCTWEQNQRTKGPVHTGKSHVLLRSEHCCLLVIKLFCIPTSGRPGNDVSLRTCAHGIATRKYPHRTMGVQ